MEELTPIRGIGWLILFSLFLALAIAGMSLRHDVQGRRVGRLLVIPLVSGVVLLAGIGVGLSDEVLDILPFLRRPLTAALALIVALVAVAVADALFTRLATLPVRLWSRRSPRTRGDVGLAVFVGGAALLGLVAVLGLEAMTDSEPVSEPVSEPAVQPAVQPATQALDALWEVQAVTDVPGPPLGITLRGERDGYLSVGGDRVMRFEVGSDGEPLELTTVAEGLTYARGLAVTGDVLVVADLGPLPPCPETFPYCKGERVDPDDTVEGERRILEESNARLVAYDIEPDGTLTGERVILDGLPVANTEHGVNDVVAGPGGLVYISIGHVDSLLPELDDVEHPRLGLLGTVIRLSPDGEGLEVFARGLRNVYGLAFDEDGALWGVDNDGATESGWWRAEEILRIRRGRHYGFPVDGSFGAPTVRDDWPIWHAEGVGSGAVSWTGDLGLGPGLLIGLAGHIDGLRLTEHRGEWRVHSNADYARLLDLPGYVTDIAPVGDGRFLAAVFDAQELYLVRVTSEE